MKCLPAGMVKASPVTHTRVARAHKQPLMTGQGWCMLLMNPSPLGHRVVRDLHQCDTGGDADVVTQGAMQTLTSAGSIEESDMLT